MFKIKYLFFLFILALPFSSAAVNVIGDIINFEDGSRTVQGVSIVYPNFNLSTINVTGASLWITSDFGPLGAVSDIRHDALYSPTLLWSNAGHDIDTDLQINGNDVLNASNVKMTNNLTVGNFAEVDGNLEVNNRLAVGINLNETSIVANPGDGVFRGNLFTSNGSFIGFPKEFAPSLSLFSFGDDAPGQTILYLGANATLNTTTGLFCDTTNSPFFTNATERFISILSSNELGLNQITLEVIIFENSSCVFIETAVFGDENVPDLTGISYLTNPAAVFVVFDKGQVTFNPNKFKLDFRNTTSHTNFEIQLTADDDGVHASHVESNTQGYSSFVNTHSTCYSSILSDGSLTINTLNDADLSNFQNGTYVANEFDLSDDGSNMDIVAGRYSPFFGDIIRIGNPEVLDIAYYDDTITTVEVTDNFTSDTSNIQIFELDNSVIYIGNSINFTQISFSLEIGANQNIIPLAYYCNTTGGYNLLSATDSTGGFTGSGSITFVSPADRGTCNTDIDGVPFANTTNFTYIAIQRNRNNLVVPPTEKIVTINSDEPNAFWNQNETRLSNGIGLWVENDSCGGVGFRDIDELIFCK